MFDKKLNEPDRINNIKMLGNKREFLEEYNYKLIVSRPGFYHVTCVNDKIAAKEKIIFQSVYTIFSKTKSKQTQAYWQHIEESKRRELTQLPRGLQSDWRWSTGTNTVLGSEGSGGEMQISSQ